METSSQTWKRRALETNENRIQTKLFRIVADSCLDSTCQGEAGTLVFGFQRNAFGSHFAGKISCIWQPQVVALGDQPRKTRNQDANRIPAESHKLRQVALGKHGQQQLRFGPRTFGLESWTWSGANWRMHCFLPQLACWHLFGRAKG